MKQPEIGQKVTVSTEIKAYYSGYAGNPEVIIEPGMIGIVTAVKVPCVNKQGFFNCVDFVIKDKFSGNPKYKNNTWRIAAKNNELVKIE